MTQCIRRAGSEYTNCPCPPCRTEMARKTKLLRNGKQAVADVRDEAWARMNRWNARGYTGGVIAGMTGLADRTVLPMLYAIREGRRHRILHATARAILAAPERPTSGSGWIPSAGTVRRLRALTVMGWSMAELAPRCGLQESTLAALRDPKHQYTRPVFATTVANLYDEMSMTQGPCKRAATRAKARGWQPPLAWDDDSIDDPSAVPHNLTQPKKRGGGQGRPVEDVIEDVEFLLEHNPDATSLELAERLGYKDPSGVQNALIRAGRNDLRAVLNRNAELAGMNVTRRTA